MAPVAMILGYLLTNGHMGALVVSVVILSPIGKRTAVDAGTAPAGGAEPWLREILQEKLDAAGVDLWISLTKQMQQLQQQQMQLVEAAVRHKSKAASPIPNYACASRTAKESEATVLDEKSLDFADEETTKANQDALKLERAAVKRVAEIAEAARTMQIERKRAAETETCVPMEEDTKTPTSMERDDEAEQRAYLARPGAEPRNLRTRVNRVPGTKDPVSESDIFWTQSKDVAVE